MTTVGTSPVLRNLEDLPPILTPKEGAQVLRVSVSYLCLLITTGRLRATDVGKVGAKRPTYRIQRADLISFVNGDTQQGKVAA